jgi:hypothetical protein
MSHFDVTSGACASAKSFGFVSCEKDLGAALRISRAAQTSQVGDSRGCHICRCYKKESKEEDR